MKLHLQTMAAFALALAAASAAVADTRQLAASAGVSDAERSGASLVEIARAKFNNDTRRDDRQVAVIASGKAGPAAYAQLAAEAGVSVEEAASMSLSELAAAKYNREAPGDDRIVIAEDSSMGAQILAFTGAPDVGRSLTVREIYLADAIRDAAGD